ncbi:hypothetical protein GQ457_07G008390 [Hibiscus cannabinus]
MYVLLELVIDSSKFECLHVSKIKDWKKNWKILSWSKLSEGEKELLLENKASLEIMYLIVDVVDILNDFNDVLLYYWVQEALL